MSGTTRRRPDAAARGRAEASTPRADEPGGRPRRVGRAPRRAPQRRGGVLGTLEQRLARRARGGRGSTLVRRRSSALLPVVSDSGYVRRVAFDTRRLHAARARAQRRRRLGRPARPRLRRVLRHRRLRLRAALAPTSSTSTCRRSSSIPLVVVDRRVVGLLVGLPSRRLTGDYLAIVTLFFFQLFLTRHEQRRRRLRPRTSTGRRRTGSSNVDPLSFFGCDAAAVDADGVFNVAYLYVALVVLRRRLRRAALRQPTRAPGAPGARCARTRSPPS